jgi:hypothetical protein
MPGKLFTKFSKPTTMLNGGEGGKKKKKKTFA